MQKQRPTTKRGGEGSNRLSQEAPGGGGIGKIAFYFLPLPLEEKEGEGIPSAFSRLRSLFCRKRGGERGMLRI